MKFTKKLRIFFLGYYESDFYNPLSKRKEMNGSEFNIPIDHWIEVNLKWWQILLRKIIKNG